MKKLASLFAIAFVFICGAEESLFSGEWLVEEDGIIISFLDDGQVEFDSEDGSVAGAGQFSFTDTTLSASILNGDMNMDILYRYEVSGDNLRVQTQTIVVNGDTLNTPDEWYTIIRQ